MKTIAAIFFLACGFFAVAFAIGQVAGWNQNPTALAITSLIFGVTGSIVGTAYLRHKKLPR